MRKEERLKKFLYLIWKILWKLLLVLCLIISSIYLFDFIFIIIREYIILPNCSVNSVVVWLDWENRHCDWFYRLYIKYLDFWLCNIFLYSSILWILYYILWDEIKKIRIYHVKIIFIIFLLIFLLYQLVCIYIDIYNFRQLEKVKIVLKDLQRWDKQFRNIKEFNKIYSTDLKPIKNCYYLKNNRSENRVLYNFWFKLESYIYIYIYKTKYYVHPKYDAPYIGKCEMWRGCYDRNRMYIEDLINNPCEDDKK